VHPENEIEEALMISAFNRRQQIEALKVATIITAVVNPEKAHESYMNLLKLMMPEYAKMRQEMDEKMFKTFDKEKGKAFVLEQKGGGFRATQIALEQIDSMPLSED